MILILGLAFCLLNAYSQDKGTFTDPRDGKVYKTVKIGTQIWFAENLAYKTKAGSYWAYDNDESNVIKYGYLYSWYAIDSIAPKGWHLPTIAEWNILYKYLGADDKKVFAALINGGSSGFNALFGGFRAAVGQFSLIELTAEFWSASNEEQSFSCNALYGTANLVPLVRDCGESIRLIKDK